MTAEPLGVIAAGHPVCAHAGADAMRNGGNAVDGALAAMLASFACEPLLTEPRRRRLHARGRAGEGAGAARLLRRGAGARGRPGAGLRRSCRSACRSATRSRCSTSGRRRSGRTGWRPACARHPRGSGGCRSQSSSAPAAKLARDGVELNGPQAYVIEILAGIVTSTPECAALFAPDGRVVRAGDVVRQPELADALERLGTEGAAPFYYGRHRGGDRRVAGGARRDGHRRGSRRL